MARTWFETEPVPKNPWDFDFQKADTQLLGVGVRYRPKADPRRSSVTGTLSDRMRMLNLIPTIFSLH